MMKNKRYLVIFVFLFLFFQSPVLAVQPVIQNAEPCSRPLAPSSVQAQTGPGVGQVTLYWSPVSNADYYTITYGLASGGYIYGFPNIGNNSQYTVSGLAQGRVYYFVLTAVNNICGSSGYSAEAQSRAGGTLPVAAGGETKGGVGWQPSSVGQSRVIPSAQPIPLTGTVVQPLSLATPSADSTISAEPSPSPTAFIPPKPEPFWRGLGFWSKVGIAAGVIFVVLLAVTSLSFKARKTELPRSSDVASPPISAGKMVAKQTVEDEPKADPLLQEQEKPVKEQEEPVNRREEPANMRAGIKPAPTVWPPTEPSVKQPTEPIEKKWLPPSQTQPEQDKEVKTSLSDNFSKSSDEPSKREELKI